MLSRDEGRRIAAKSPELLLSSAGSPCVSGHGPRQSQQDRKSRAPMAIKKNPEAAEAVRWLAGCWFRSRPVAPWGAPIPKPSLRAVWQSATSLCLRRERFDPHVHARRDGHRTRK